MKLLLFRAKAALRILRGKPTAYNMGVSIVGSSLVGPGLDAVWFRDLTAPTPTCIYLNTEAVKRVTKFNIKGNGL